jgi:purine-binding chemotaxis protein CheW
MKQLLPFTVGYETYALELLDIQEVVENQQIHLFLGSPEVVAGAINFHGRIVPVVHLARLLNIPAEKIGHRLIVLANHRGPVALGVDQVQAVINIEADPNSQPENNVENSYVNNVIDWCGKRVSLLDLDQLQVKLELLCTQMES